MYLSAYNVLIIRMISAKLTDDRPFTTIIQPQFYNTSPVPYAVLETLWISVGALFQQLKYVKANPDIRGAPWRLFPMLSVLVPFHLTTAGGTWIAVCHLCQCCA